MDELDKYIVENNSQPDHLKESNRSIARRFGINESSVRKRRKRLAKAGRAGLLPVDGKDVMFGVPVGAVSERKRTVRHADGSYDIIRFKPNYVNHDEVKRLTYEDLSKVLEEPVEPPQEVQAGTLVVCLSDFQCGKTDERGGSAQTIERVSSMLHQVAQTVSDRGGYSEIILADLGDSTEGFGNTVQQQQTNDLSLTDQVRVVTRLHAEAIKLLHGYCERMWFVTVPSNHCQVRNGTGGKARANAPDDDYGILVNDMLKMWAEEREHLNHVIFAVPQKWEETVTIQTADGTCVGFTHGHLAGSRSNVAKWFSDMSFGQRSGLQEASVLVHGHFHSFSLETVGNGKTVVCAPSADNGSSWFTNKTGHSSESQMLTFEVSSGKTSSWRLYSA